VEPPPSPGVRFELPVAVIPEVHASDEASEKVGGDFGAASNMNLDLFDLR